MRKEKPKEKVNIAHKILNFVDISVHHLQDKQYLKVLDEVYDTIEHMIDTKKDELENCKSRIQS